MYNVCKYIYEFVRLVIKDMNPYYRSLIPKDDIMPK